MWICFKTISGREFVAAKEIDKLGGSGCVPWEYKSYDAVSVSGRKYQRRVKRPMCHGYVFGCWLGQVPRDELREIKSIDGKRLIRGVLVKAGSDEVAVFADTDLSALITAGVMSSRPNGGRRGFRVGDMVRIRNEHKLAKWTETTARRVEAIKRGLPQLSVVALGKAHLVSFMPSDLVRVSDVEKAA